MRSLSVDLGGTRIKLGIVDGSRIVRSVMIEAFSGEGLARRLPVIEQAARGLCDGTGVDLKEIAGFGIAMPGIIDTVRMRLLSVNKKYADAVDLNFVQWSRDRFGLPLVMENDARAALAGEWQYGAGAGSDNLVMITLGTGIGGAALVEGKLLRGKHFQAGCLGGHFTINFGGDDCNCGNIGCVESEASSWSLPDRARHNPAFSSSLLSREEVIDYKTLFSLARKHDALSEQLVHHSLQAWSSGIVNLVHAYDPERVIMGGGLMRSADDILPYIRQYVLDHAWTPWGTVSVAKAHDIDNAALLGMGYLLQQAVHQT